MTNTISTIHLSIDARDGYPLAATLFEPARAPLAAVLINSATAVPQRHYAAYARFLAAQGFVVLTYDYRGVAGSRWPAMERPMATRMRDWGELDLAGALDHLADRYPQLPLLAVGHSVGGQLLGFAPNRHRFSAALNVASQVAYWRFWDGAARTRIALLWHAAIPLTVAALGKLPAWMTGWELPGGVAREWARWGRHADFFVDERGRALHEGFSAWTAPMRLIAISDDHDYAPPRAVAALASLYRHAPVDVQTLTPAAAGRRQIGHFGFFRDDMSRAVWLDTVHWLRAQLQTPAALPLAA